MNNVFKTLASLCPGKGKYCRIKNAKGYLIYQGSYGDTAKKMRKEKGNTIEFKTHSNQ